MPTRAPDLLTSSTVDRSRGERVDRCNEPLIATVHCSPVLPGDAPISWGRGTCSDPAHGGDGTEKGEGRGAMACL